MKHPLTRLLVVLFAALVSPGLRADDATLIAAVRAADDERVAAMISADPSRLGAVLSDDLHYVHSNGKTDTKASYLESIATHHTVYESVAYVQRDFRPASPGVVLMTGQAKLKVGNSGQKTEADISFLAVWRRENGQWRFLAWQSCKNSHPEAGVPTGLKVDAAVH